MKSFFNLRRTNESRSVPAKLTKDSQKARAQTTPQPAPLKQKDATPANSLGRSEKPRYRATTVPAQAEVKLPPLEDIPPFPPKKRSSSRPPVPFAPPHHPPVSTHPQRTAVPTTADPIVYATRESTLPPQLAQYDSRNTTQLDKSRTEAISNVPPPLPPSIQPPPTARYADHVSQDQQHAQDHAPSKQKHKDRSRRDKDDSRHRDGRDRDRDKEVRREAREREKEKDREQRRRERDLAKALEREDRERQLAKAEREAREQAQREREARELEERARAKEAEDKLRAQEREAKRKAQEQEDRRRIQEQEDRRRAQEMEERRRAQEQEEKERRRVQEKEEKEKRRALEYEERRRAQEQEARRRAQGLEDARRAQEIEEKRRAQELELQRKAYESEEKRRAQELEERRRMEQRRLDEERRRVQDHEDARRALEKEERRRAQEYEDKRRAKEKERLERDERERREKALYRENRDRQRDKERERERARDKRDREPRRDADRDERRRIKEREAMHRAEHTRRQNGTYDSNQPSLQSTTTHQPLHRPALAVIGRPDEGESSDSSRRRNIPVSSGHRRFYTDEGITNPKYASTQSGPVLQAHVQVNTHEHAYGKAQVAVPPGDRPTRHTRSSSLPQDVPVQLTRSLQPAPAIQRDQSHLYPLTPVDPNPPQKFGQSQHPHVDARQIYQTAAGSKFVESSHVTASNPGNLPKPLDRSSSAAPTTPFPATNPVITEPRLSQIVSIRAGQGPADPQVSDLFPKLGSHQLKSGTSPGTRPRHVSADSPGIRDTKALNGVSIPVVGISQGSRAVPERAQSTAPAHISQFNQVNSSTAENFLPASADSGYASASKQHPIRPSPDKRTVSLSVQQDLGLSNGPRFTSGRRTESSPTRARPDVPPAARYSPNAIRREPLVPVSNGHSNHVNVQPTPSRPSPDVVKSTTAPLPTPPNHLERIREVPTKATRPSPTLSKYEVGYSSSSPAQKKEVPQPSRPSPMDRVREIVPQTSSYSPAQGQDIKQDGLGRSLPVAHVAVSEKQDSGPNYRTAAQSQLNQLLSHEHSPSFDPRGPPPSRKYEALQHSIVATQPIRVSPDTKRIEISPPSREVSSVPHRDADDGRTHKTTHPSPVAPAPIVPTASHASRNTSFHDDQLTKSLADTKKPLFKESIDLTTPKHSNTLAYASQPSPSQRDREVSKPTATSGADLNWGRAQAAKLANLLSHTSRPTPVSDAAAYAAKMSAKLADDKPNSVEVNQEVRHTSSNQNPAWEPLPTQSSVQPNHVPRNGALETTFDLRSRANAGLVTESTSAAQGKANVDSPLLAQRPRVVSDMNSQPGATKQTTRDTSSHPIASTYITHQDMTPRANQALIHNSSTPTSKPIPISSDQLYQPPSQPTPLSHPTASAFPSAARTPISAAYIPPSLSSANTGNGSRSSPGQPINTHDSVDERPSLRTDALASTNSQPLNPREISDQPPVPLHQSSATPVQSYTQPSGDSFVSEDNRMDMANRFHEGGPYASAKEHVTNSKTTRETGPRRATDPVVNGGGIYTAHPGPSVETLLATPSSLAPSMLKPTHSRASLAPSTESQKKKGRIFGLFGRKHRDVPVDDTKDRARRAPTPDIEQQPPTLSSRVKVSPPVIVPAYTPFTHLMPKRHPTMSLASLDAQDGTAGANTTIGSPTVSMHSQSANPVILPPQRDAQRDTEEWVGREASSTQDRRGRNGRPIRHKPGVVFNVEDDDYEDKPRAKISRRGTGRERGQRERERDRSRREGERTDII